MNCRYVLLILMFSCGLAAAQWQRCTMPYTTNTAVISAIVADSHNTYAGGTKGLYRSKDHGQSWSLIQLPYSINYGSANTAIRDSMPIAIFIDGPLMLVGTFWVYQEDVMGGLYRSLDSGKTWAMITLGCSEPCLTMQQCLKVGSTIIIATDGVYRSFDSGSTWHISDSGLPTEYSCPAGSAGCSYREITNKAIAANDSFIFAGTISRYYDIGPGFDWSWQAQGVYRSADTGVTWTQASSGLTDSNIQCLAVNGSNLFAGTMDSGVFISTNNGNSWIPINSGLTCMNIRSLLAVGSHLFAGTEGKGVFHSSDSGQSWHPFNNGLTDSTIAPLATDSTYIYAGSDSSGGHVWRFPLADIAVLKQNRNSLQPFGLKVMAAGRSSSTIGIAFSLAHADRVKLGIFSLSGHVLGTLLDKQLAAGEHTVAWDGKSVGSGCYVVRLEAGGTMETKAVPAMR